MTTRTSLRSAQERLAAVRDKLPAWGVDAVLITSASNRRWLSGFTGSVGRLLVTRDKALLATDFRYWEQSASETTGWHLFKQRNRDNELESFIRSVAAGCIGVEASQLTVAEFEKLRAIDGIEWKSLASTLEPMRMVKDEGELELMRAAARIADAAMSQVPSLAKPGMSERTLAWALEKAMREAGADNVAFTPLVASGPNSALPHHRAGDRQLQIGDTLIVDIGAEIQGYRSDLTRTFFLGDTPSDEFWRLHNIVESAQEVARDRARAGMNAGQVDGLARERIATAGYRDQFGHGLGHGVGLDVHERPFLSALPSASEVIVLAGCVVTMEPGIYIPGWGGIRIEDMVRFKEDGLELLTRCPKSPIIRA